MQQHIVAAIAGFVGAVDNYDGNSEPAQAGMAILRCIAFLHTRPWGPVGEPSTQASSTGPTNATISTARGTDGYEPVAVAEEGTNRAVPASPEPFDTMSDVEPDD